MVCAPTAKDNSLLRGLVLSRISIFVSNYISSKMDQLFKCKNSNQQGYKINKNSGDSTESYNGKYRIADNISYSFASQSIKSCKCSRPTL